MYPVHSYTASQLDKLLHEPCVVVLSDPRRQLGPFIGEFRPLQTNAATLGILPDSPRWAQAPL